MQGAKIKKSRLYFTEIFQRTLSILHLLLTFNLYMIIKEVYKDENEDGYKTGSVSMT